MHIEIHSVRAGHACNSSSTHTLFLTRRRPTKIDASSLREEGANIWMETRDKRRALARMVLSAMLAEGYDRRFAAAFVKSVTGTDLTDEEIRKAEPPERVLIPIPMSAVAKGFHTGYIGALAKIVDNPASVVFSGEDHLIEKIPEWTGMQDDEFIDLGEVFMDISRNGEIVCRQHIESGRFTLFNRTTGDRLRIIIHRDGITKSDALPSSPELVDLTITRYCEMACPYCYQSSGPNGKEGDHIVALQVMQALKKLEVLEVAIGGGEPLLYEHLWTLTSLAQGMNVNVTTRLPHLLRRPDNRELYREVRAFAVSVEPGSDYHGLLRTLIDISGIRDASRKWQLNLIMGFWRPSDIDDLFEAMKTTGCVVPILLLGFKPGQRMKKPPLDYDPAHGQDAAINAKTILDRIDEHAWRLYDDPVSAIRADSLLTRQLGTLLDAYGVPKSAIVNEEGRYSCAIEVTHDGKVIVSANSYDPEAPKAVVRGRVSAETIAAAFRKVQRMVVDADTSPGRRRVIKSRR